MIFMLKPRTPLPAEGLEISLEEPEDLARLDQETLAKKCVCGIG